MSGSQHTFTGKNKTKPSFNTTVRNRGEHQEKLPMFNVSSTGCHTLVAEIAVGTVPKDFRAPMQLGLNLLNEVRGEGESTS